MQKKVNWIIADALALPFGNDSFEKAISAYLLRNVPDLQACLVEQFRIMRKDGRIVAMETTPPQKSLFSPIIIFLFRCNHAYPGVSLRRGLSCLPVSFEKHGKFLSGR